jgi:glutamyl-tRNA synthetase
VLRNEDLDQQRCKPEFVSAMLEDLRWFGFLWQEGPDCGGSFGPYVQSQRRQFYVDAWKKLHAGGFLYPCCCSRQDVLRALRAPHAGEDEPIYPGTCRPISGQTTDILIKQPRANAEPSSSLQQRFDSINWRFRVPDGEVISFIDGNFGQQQFEAGKDFGDFVIWRHDDVPSYQLAVVIDDSAMEITEVVRGEDLLLSTARQLLLYRALGLTAPEFYHCPLVRDDSGQRLAKRHDAMSLRALRAKGTSLAELRKALFRNNDPGKMQSTC